MTRDAGANAASAPDSRQCEAKRIRARVTAKTGASPPPCPYPDAQRPVPVYYTTFFVKNGDSKGKS